MTGVTPEAQLTGRRATGLGAALVGVGLVVAVIGSLGAPLITPVSNGLHLSLDAAQWTLTVTLFAGAIAGPVLSRLGSGPLRRRVILSCLTIVVVGGILTTIAVSFPLLLLGRTLQGIGLGGVPLLMSVARGHLSDRRAASTISALSVASTVGIGVGYPLMGFLDQIAGLRAAYGCGLALSLTALLVAWIALPAEPPGPLPHIDWLGGLLLAVATLGLLLLVAEPAVWRSPATAVAISAVAGASLLAWVLVELRTATPLVDVRLLSTPSVLRANMAMAVAGVGLYLLFSVFTRYVQTPADAAYGFALPGAAAGAALIPFSVLGFLAGKASPSLIARSTARWVYVGASVTAMVAAVVFATASGSLAAVLIAMAVLGYGVGGISAAMPVLVLVGVPQSETASVLTINQVVRSIGFAVGSALAGVLLATATPAGAVLPTQQGFVTAAWWSLLPLGLAAVVIGAAGTRSRLGADSPSRRRTSAARPDPGSDRATPRP